MSLTWACLLQCSRARWLRGAYKASGNRFMTWQQPRSERPWIPSACGGKLYYHNRNHLVHLCAPEGNADKDQSQFTIAKLAWKCHFVKITSQIATLAIKKWCFVSLWIYSFYIYEYLFPLFLLSAYWILVFFIQFTGLWNLCACVTDLQCGFHILHYICQEICWWKALNMKHIQRAWACMMCENQIPVRSHTCDV